MRPVTLIIGLTLSLCSAQEVQRIAGPLVGFLAGPASPEIRPIRGVPGAAVAGPPLPLPDGISRVRLAPGQLYALVELDGAALAVLRLEDGGSPVPIEGALFNADLVAFSPAGRSVALWSAGRSVVQVLTGLPDTPRVLREAPLGETVRIAVSDDGESLLAGDPNGTVNRILPDGHAVPAFVAPGLTAMAFLPGRSESVICDGARGDVHLLSEETTRLLASGLAGASAAAASSGGTLLVVSAEASRAWTIEIATGVSRAFELPASPVSLDLLRLRDSFLISSREGDPSWLLVTGDSGARSYFVPAVTRESK